MSLWIVKSLIWMFLDSKTTKLKILTSTGIPWIVKSSIRMFLDPKTSKSKIVTSRACPLDRKVFNLNVFGSQNVQIEIF